MDEIDEQEVEAEIEEADMEEHYATYQEADEGEGRAYEQVDDEEVARGHSFAPGQDHDEAEVERDGSVRAYEEEEP